MSALRTHTSLSFEQRLQLMAYADGELDTFEAAAVERLLNEQPAARELLAELRSLSGRLGELSFASPDLGDAILAQLAPARPLAAAPPFTPPVSAPVAPLFDLRSARARRFALWSAVGAAVAVAAAFTLWLRAVPLTLAVEPQLTSLGVEVERVDSQENVTVFSIPALHSNASSVVVWLGDAEGESAWPKPALNAPEPAPSNSEPPVEPNTP